MFYYFVDRCCYLFILCFLFIFLFVLCCRHLVYHKTIVFFLFLFFNELKHISFFLSGFLYGSLVIVKSKPTSWTSAIFFVFRISEFISILQYYCSLQLDLVIPWCDHFHHLISVQDGQNMCLSWDLKMKCNAIIRLIEE